MNLLLPRRRPSREILDKTDLAPKEMMRSLEDLDFVVAVDLQWRHLVAGRARFCDGRAPAVAADAFDLPFPDGSTDWIVSTLFFHHFSPSENIRLLKELARVSRAGFALLDIRRSLLPLLFVALVGRVAFKSRVSL